MGYYDDDDDLDAWMQQQAQDASLSGLLEPEQQPMVQQFASQPGSSIHLPPERSSSMADIKTDYGAPDWTDALGLGTTALAALADLGLNHGRGTGQILSAGGAFGQARGEQRLRQTQDMIGYEEKRAAADKSNRYQDYLFANLAQKQRGASPGQITANQQAQLDARKVTSDRLEQERQDRLAKQSREDEDRDAARDDRSSAREDRNNQFTLGMEDRKAARETAEAERAQRDADRQQYQADRASDKKEVNDDKTTREFAKDTETSRSMAQQMKELSPLLEKYKDGDIPGTGKVDQWIPNAVQDYVGGDSEDATRIDQLKTGLQAEYRHAKTGAAASVPEDLRLMIVNGTKPGSTEQEFRLGMEALKKALPLQIKAYGAGREDQARAVLREQGLEDYVYGPSAPAQQSSGTTNYGPDDAHPSNLGVGPGGRSNASVPKFNLGASGAADGGGGGVDQARGTAPMMSGQTGMLSVVSPNGTPGMVTPEQWQQLQGRPGWRMQ